MYKHELTNDHIHLLGDIELALGFPSLVPEVSKILREIEDTCEAYTMIAYLLLIRLQHRATEAQLNNGRGELKQRVYQAFVGNQYHSYEQFEDEVLHAVGNLQADKLKMKFYNL